MSKKVRLYTDGGARGNPGPAGIGAIIYDLNNPQAGALARISEFIGHATNNQAEYRALIAGLEKAVELGAEEVEVVSDSELLVKQCRGEYRVKNPDLAVLFVKVWNLTQKFKKVTFSHSLRSGNTEADALVNLAIDKNSR